VSLSPPVLRRPTHDAWGSTPLWFVESLRARAPACQPTGCQPHARAQKDRTLPPGCHGNLLYTGLDGTRRNGTGTVTVEKDCKSTPHYGFFFFFAQVQSLSRLQDLPKTATLGTKAAPSRQIARLWLRGRWSGTEAETS
jgi:hypothetical protein